MNSLTYFLASRALRWLEAILWSKSKRDASFASSNLLGSTLQVAFSPSARLPIFPACSWWQNRRGKIVSLLVKLRLQTAFLQSVLSAWSRPPSFSSSIWILLYPLLTPGLFAKAFLGRPLLLWLVGLHCSACRHFFAMCLRPIPFPSYSFSWDNIDSLSVLFKCDRVRLLAVWSDVIAPCGICSPLVSVFWLTLNVAYYIESSSGKGTRS